MSFEFAEKFWFLANDNGGQPRERVERPGIAAIDGTGNVKFPRARPRHEAQERIEVILIPLWVATHLDGEDDD
jgi:hypothetical protein